MISWHLVFAAAFCFASLVQLGNGYRILCVFPTPCFSHQMVFRVLTLALNQRGHELVVVTPNPINDSTRVNYTEIDVSSINEPFSRLNFLAHTENTNYQTVEDFSSTLLLITDQILGHPDLRKLYASDSNEKFDLLMVEMLYYPSVFSLAERFNVPVIGVSTLGLAANIQYAIGDPILPSHHGTWELGQGIYQSSFWQRLKNFVVTWKYLYWYKTTYIPKHAVIAKKYFGNDVSDLNDLEKNVSLIFVNQQGPISHAKPSVPNVVQIGGSHISKNIKSLPKDLQKFLDEATTGFVYMSLGSTGKSSMLPPETINQFIAGFSRLPYKVLWKFEDDVLPGKPENVHIMKWVPQQAVLAHPNLKVFVYQGGLQSTEEAVAHAVPLVGFPSFADQHAQVKKMTSLGVALKLELNAVDGNTLFEAINTVASDSSYKQRMLNLRSIFEDRPYDPIDNAVWWTEYVMRHKGAPHLHSSTADEPWYTRQSMDIVAFITATSLIVLSFTIVILHRLIKGCGGAVSSVDMKKKRS